MSIYQTYENCFLKEEIKHVLTFKNCQLVRELVNFDESVGNAWIEGKGFQSILVNGRGKVIWLNRLPVFLQGERIDIMDMFT